MSAAPPTAEHRRLSADRESPVPPWRLWGCYVSDRAWGTVREDYSPNGDAWRFISHDHARSKAYRWGEDAIAGLCDRYQLLVFGPAFWNGADPMLKERLFGLTPEQGNHGEDVKECYFYVDNTPTHSYMRMLYKYPHAAFPYERLVAENARRGPGAPEFELADTGVFDRNEYFDIVIEYAKASPEDVSVRIEAFNRGDRDSELHLIPQLWFRNTWSWGAARGPQPVISLASNDAKGIVLCADDSAAEPLEDGTFEYSLGEGFLIAPPGGEPLFTDNETNAPVVWGPGARSASPYTKDAFHRYIVNGEAAVNPMHTGTKAGVHYRATVRAGGSVVWRFRISPDRESSLVGVDYVVQQRRAEADEFYDLVHPPRASNDERFVQRQALAGMLWSKQVYLFDVRRWLDGDNPAEPPPSERRSHRNAHWRHLSSTRILSVPDKWEYPFFAAWDLAFQSVALALVDVEFAKQNLSALLSEQLQHPNGQIPASESEFSDNNLPVHAWACWHVYSLEKERTSHGDRLFLERAFHKLLVNFTWWANRVDSQGLNVFEGGLIAFDDLAFVHPAENGATRIVREQSDGTGWMALNCLSMMRIALELAAENHAYEALATKFLQHFAGISAAMANIGGRGHHLWDDDDGFFYGVLRFPDGGFAKVGVRSLAGLVPLFAIETIDERTLRAAPAFQADVNWLMNNRPALVRKCPSDKRGGSGRHLFSIVDGAQLERLLARICDPDEFLSVGGIRSLSKHHADHPFIFGPTQVRYEPGEATDRTNGNSNWRGPVWLPTTFLLIESLAKFGRRDRARELADRFIALFTRDGEGRRRIFGDASKFHTDPFWRDQLLFHEYFHGDTGAGLGASHHTGCTALIASVIDEWRREI